MTSNKLIWSTLKVVEKMLFMSTSCAWLDTDCMDQWGKTHWAKNAKCLKHMTKAI